MTTVRLSSACRCHAAVLLLLASAPLAMADQVDQLLTRVGVRHGICVVLGASSDTLALELARRSELLIYVQLSDPSKVAQLREAAHAAGLSATQIHIEQGDVQQLHLASNLADAAIVTEPGSPADLPELMRVLRPRGKALIGDKTTIKPVPDGTDDWTHPYHGPDNNPLSQDTRIVAPYLTQFLANPRYGPAPQVAVSAGGRVFKAYGNVAWHEREEPYLNSIVAYDGYNGTILWQYKLPEGMMVHRNVFVATPETLFVGDDKSCKLIDAATGEVRDEIRPPLEVAGGTFWKWMALEGDTLYAVMGEQEMKDDVKHWRRTEHGWPWHGISPGYNVEKQPWGYGRNVLAIDVATKKVLWHYREEEPIDSRAVCMSDGQLYGFRFGSFLTCLDTATGDLRWRKTKESDPQLFESMGTYLPRQSWQTNWRTAAYLKCSKEALYFAGTQMDKLLALSTEDGRLLWQHPYNNFQLVLRPEAVYAISGPWGENVSQKIEPLTGTVLAELPTGRRACTRPTGTSDSIIFRAMGGSVRFDIDSAQPRWLSPMRPSCHDGVTIANNSLYWWPYACDCQLNLYGVTCLSSAGDFDFTPNWRAPQRQQEFPRAETVAALKQSENDWPTFRANNQGTARSGAAIAETTEVLWKVNAIDLEGARPTPPVAVGDLVFLGGSDGAVRALNLRDGGQRWKSHTGGEVRLPPTVWKGRAIVGSGDGWVSCFEATSGRPLWRYRGAPAERLIPVYGKLLSTWPVSSGVLVEGDAAYFAAGIVNYDGTYVYALDAATGYVRWCNDTSGHLDPQAQVGVSAQGHLLSHAGQLYLAGGNAVSPAIYDQRDGSCLNEPAELAKCESTSPRGWELFLVGDRVIACGNPYYAHPDLNVYDHTVTKKILHTRTGDRDIVWLDNQTLMCFDPIDTESLNKCVTDEKIPRHITQAWGEFKVEQKPHWGFNTPTGNAIGVASNAVVLGTDDGVIAVNIQTGKQMWSHKLATPVVPWGLAITRNGQVIVTLTDGNVVCIGKK